MGVSPDIVFVLRDHRFIVEGKPEKCSSSVSSTKSIALAWRHLKTRYSDIIIIYPSKIKNGSIADDK